LGTVTDVAPDIVSLLPLISQNPLMFFRSKRKSRVYTETKEGYGIKPSGYDKAMEEEESRSLVSVEPHGLFQLIYHIFGILLEDPSVRQRSRNPLTLLAEIYPSELSLAGKTQIERVVGYYALDEVSEQDVRNPAKRDMFCYRLGSDMIISNVEMAAGLRAAHSYLRTCRRRDKSPQFIASYFEALLRACREVSKVDPSNLKYNQAVSMYHILGIVDTLMASDRSYLQNNPVFRSFLIDFVARDALRCFIWVEEVTQISMINDRRRELHRFWDVIQPGQLSLVKFLRRLVKHHTAIVSLLDMEENVPKEDWERLTFLIHPVDGCVRQYLVGTEQESKVRWAMLNLLKEVFQTKRQYFLTGHIGKVVVDTYVAFHFLGFFKEKKMDSKLKTAHLDALFAIALCKSPHIIEKFRELGVVQYLTKEIGLEYGILLGEGEGGGSSNFDFFRSVDLREKEISRRSPTIKGSSVPGLALTRTMTRGFASVFRRTPDKGPSRSPLRDVFSLKPDKSKEEEEVSFEVEQLSPARSVETSSPSVVSPPIQSHASPKRPPKPLAGPSGRIVRSRESTDDESDVRASHDADEQDDDVLDQSLQVSDDDADDADDADDDGSGGKDRPKSGESQQSKSDERLSELSASSSGSYDDSDIASIDGGDDEASDFGSGDEDYETEEERGEDEGSGCESDLESLPDTRPIVKGVTMIGVSNDSGFNIKSSKSPGSPVVTSSGGQVPTKGRRRIIFTQEERGQPETAPKIPRLSLADDGMPVDSYESTDDEKPPQKDVDVFCSDPGGLMDMEREIAKSKKMQVWMLKRRDSLEPSTLAKQTDEEEYKACRDSRLIYQDTSLHASTLSLLFILMCHPEKGIDLEYVQHERNVLFLLSFHMNEPANNHVLPIVHQRIVESGWSEAFVLFKLICRCMFDPKIFRNRKKIGSGAYGTVYQCTVHDVPVALKVTPVPQNEYDRNTLIDMFTEILILERLRGDRRIVHLYDYGVDRDSYYIVMKYYPTTLTQWRKDHPSEDVCTYLKIFASILDTFRMIHESGIIHFDIKMDNLMLETHEEQSEIVAADFGESVINREHTQRNRGTEYIKSPEMLTIGMATQKELDTFDRRKSSGASFSSDIWSLGCLLYEVVTGEMLFYDDDWIRFFIRVTSPNEELLTEERVSKVPERAIVDFLRYTLIRNPLRRPSITNVIHRFAMVYESIFRKTHQMPIIGGGPASDGRLFEEMHKSNPHFAPRTRKGAIMTNITLTDLGSARKRHVEKSDGRADEEKEQSPEREGKGIEDGNGDIVVRVPEVSKVNPPKRSASADRDAMVSRGKRLPTSSSTVWDKDDFFHGYRAVPSGMGQRYQLFFRSVASKITPDIYLGSYLPAMCPQYMFGLGITHLINFTGNPLCSGEDAIYSPKEMYEYVLDPHPSADMVSSAILEMESVLEKKGRLFVFGEDGLNRSGFFVMMYLVHKHFLSIFEAFSFVKGKRPATDFPPPFLVERALTEMKSVSIGSLKMQPPYFKGWTLPVSSLSSFGGHSVRLGGMTTPTSQMSAEDLAPNSNIGMYLDQSISLSGVIACQCICGTCSYVVVPKFHLRAAQVHPVLADLTDHPFFLKEMQHRYGYQAPRVHWVYCEMSNCILNTEDGKWNTSPPGRVGTTATSVFSRSTVASAFTSKNSSWIFHQCDKCEYVTHASCSIGMAQLCAVNVNGIVRCISENEGVKRVPVCDMRPRLFIQKTSDWRTFEYKRDIKRPDLG
jgi:serine/threonine protein kinase